MNYFQINGIYYDLNECKKTAQVTNGPDEPRGWVSIPETVSHNGVTYSVTSIGDGAFFLCTELTIINIPNSVTDIGYSAFHNCYRLTSVYIPNSVTSIGRSAFEGCESLRSVNIPNSVTSIGDFAFWGCEWLKSITIPNSVTSIGDEAFCHCSGLRSINISNSVTKIGEFAFHNCEGLTFVNIPDSVTNIGDSVFDDCSSLTSINVETGNTIYDSRNNCNAIIETATNTLITGCKNTTIPNSVTSIGDNAFWGCKGLTSISIPDSVTSIGGFAFDGCDELTDVYCYAENMPSTEYNVFNNSDIRKATLHVPAASIEQYKTTEPWSNFGTIVAIDDTETQAS